MGSKRTGPVAGAMLVGALLLGGAGLVAAQGPTATPTPSPTAAGLGGMMGGQMGKRMMGMMTADHLEQMNALHDQMIASGVCDPARMQALHAQLNADR